MNNSYTNLPAWFGRLFSVSSSSPQRRTMTSLNENNMPPPSLTHPRPTSFNQFIRQHVRNSFSERLHVLDRNDPHTNFTPSSNDRETAAIVHPEFSATNNPVQGNQNTHNSNKTDDMKNNDTLQAAQPKFTAIYPKHQTQNHHQQILRNNSNHRKIYNDQEQQQQQQQPQRQNQQQQHQEPKQQILRNNSNHRNVHDFWEQLQRQQPNRQQTSPVRSLVFRNSATLNNRQHSSQSSQMTSDPSGRCMVSLPGQATQRPSGPLDHQGDCATGTRSPGNRQEARVERVEMETMLRSGIPFVDQHIPGIQHNGSETPHGEQSVFGMQQDETGIPFVEKSIPCIQRSGLRIPFDEQNTSNTQPIMAFEQSTTDIQHNRAEIYVIDHTRGADHDDSGIQFELQRMPSMQNSTMGMSFVEQSMLGIERNETGIPAMDHILPGPTHHTGTGVQLVEHSTQAKTTTTTTTTRLSSCLCIQTKAGMQFEKLSVSGIQNKGGGLTFMEQNMSGIEHKGTGIPTVEESMLGTQQTAIKNNARTADSYHYHLANTNMQDHPENDMNEHAGRFLSEAGNKKISPYRLLTHGDNSAFNIHNSPVEESLSGNNFVYYSNNDCHNNNHNDDDDHVFSGSVQFSKSRQAWQVTSEGAELQPWYYNNYTYSMPNHSRSGQEMAAVTAVPTFTHPVPACEANVSPHDKRERAWASEKVRRMFEELNKETPGVKDEYCTPGYHSDQNAQGRHPNQFQDDASQTGDDEADDSAIEDKGDDDDIPNSQNGTGLSVDQFINTNKIPLLDDKTWNEHNVFFFGQAHSPFAPSSTNDSMHSCYDTPSYDGLCVQESSHVMTQSTPTATSPNGNNESTASQSFQDYNVKYGDNNIGMPQTVRDSHVMANFTLNEADKVTPSDGDVALRQEDCVAPQSYHTRDGEKEFETLVSQVYYGNNPQLAGREPLPPARLPFHPFYPKSSLGDLEVWVPREIDTFLSSSTPPRPSKDRCKLLDWPWYLRKAWFSARLKWEESTLEAGKNDVSVMPLIPLCHKSLPRTELPRLDGEDYDPKKNEDYNCGDLDVETSGVTADCCTEEPMSTKTSDVTKDDHAKQQTYNENCDVTENGCTEQQNAETSDVIAGDRPVLQTFSFKDESQCPGQQMCNDINRVTSDSRQFFTASNNMERFDQIGRLIPRLANTVIDILEMPVS